MHNKFIFPSYFIQAIFANDEWLKLTLIWDFLRMRRFYFLVCLAHEDYFDIINFNEDLSADIKISTLFTFQVKSRIDN